MIATIVLGRILAPADFGIVTIVTTFSLLLMSFGLNGFTEAVIQSEKIDHRLASNLFWINIGVGLLLTLGFASAGSLLARLFGEPRVANASVAISASIFLASTSALHTALLKRAMRFSLVAIIDIIARVVSVAASIILGLAGWGYWALVVGIVAVPFVTCLGAWSLCRWIPGFPRRVPGTATLVLFAINVYGHFVVNYAGLNTDNLLVGWRFHAEALGFYKRAFDLFVLPASQLLWPVGAVAMSALRKFKQDHVQFRQHFLGVVSIFAFLGMAIGADLTLVGKDVIRILLGARWEASGRIFTFFGPGIGVMLIYGTHGWIHVSIGKAERWFRWGVIELTVTVALFLLCLPWGPAGIAVAWSSSFWILLLPAFWYAGRPIQLGVPAMLSAIWKYILGSLVAGGCSALIVSGIPSLSALSGVLGAGLRIVIVSALFSALYLLLVIILHGGLAPIHQVARLSRDMLPQGWLSKRSPRVNTAVADDAVVSEC
jgi:PST family polysaccharide transporter